MTNWMKISSRISSSRSWCRLPWCLVRPYCFILADRICLFVKKSVPWQILKALYLIFFCRDFFSRGVVCGLCNQGTSDIREASAVREWRARHQLLDVHLRLGHDKFHDTRPHHCHHLRRIWYQWLYRRWQLGVRAWFCISRNLLIHQDGIT